tara:strand:+ start:34 stop:429 length:396 start_codon:yes stop_codon:yes gene_type:complete
VDFIVNNIWVILIAILSGGALIWPSLMRNKNTLNTLEATQLINKGNILVLDLRSKEDFNLSHLRASKNIPFNELTNNLNKLDKSKAVLLICEKGIKAPQSASKLLKDGFENVYILEGGFSAWQTQGLPTTA